MRAALVAALVAGAAAVDRDATTGCVIGAFDETADVFAESKTLADVASGWTISYQMFYKTLTAGGQTYQLVQCYQDAAAQAAAEAKLPLCGEGCQRMGIPVKGVALAGTMHTLGMLEELRLVDRIKALPRKAASPCVQSKGVETTDLTDGAQMGTVEAVFMDKQNAVPEGTSAETRGKLVRLAVDDEESPLARAEWVEFVSAFFNLEGEANYVMERARLLYDEQSHVARGLAKKKVAWVTGHDKDAQTVTFTSSGFLKKLATDVNAELVYFGETVSLDTNTKLANYRLQMKEVDLVVYGLPGATSLQTVLQSYLNVDFGDASYKFYTDSTYAVFAMDRYVVTGADMLWEEETPAHPDLLLADLVRALHGADSNAWGKTPHMFMRPLALKPFRLPQSADACAKGFYRVSDAQELRHSLLGVVEAEASNPSGPVTNFNVHRDYFPAKALLRSAEDFSVEYHLTWKLIRLTRDPKDVYMLLQRGVPASARPSAYVLPNAKRFEIPVTAVGSYSTPATGIERLVGNPATLKVAGQTPDPCVQKAIQDEKVTLLPGSFGDREALAATLDLYFPSAWSPDGKLTPEQNLPNAVLSRATADPGPLNRVEWLKLHAAFHNNEKLATDVYNGMYRRYLCVAQKGRAANSLLGRTPVLAGVTRQFGSEDDETKWRVTLSRYWVAQVEHAGGTTEANSLSEHGTKMTQNDESFYLFDSLAKLKLGLADVDVMIDEFYHGSNADNVPQWEDVKAVYQFTEAEMTSLKVLKNKKVFRFDRRIAKTFAFIDQFARAVYEPDAVVEDMITMLHPGWRDRSSLHFFRNIMEGGDVYALEPSKCESFDKRDEPLGKDNDSCFVTCEERTSEDYCKIDCVWVNGKCARPVTPPSKRDTEGSDAGALAPALAVVAAAVVALLL